MTKYQLLPGPDGSIVSKPYPDEDREPQPGDEVWALAERGIEVYCVRCGAPLEISRAQVRCSKDEKHFNVII